MKTRTVALIALIIAFIAVVVLALMYESQVNMAPTAMLPITIATTTTSTTTATSTSSSTSPAPATSTSSLYPPPALGETQGIVTLGGQTIYVDLAENPAQQELGLGNRASLGAHQGMLFIFPNDDIHEFWMKDMSFSIDMIWMSDDGTVIYIQPNTSPATYPTAFGPNGVSRYVLEVPAKFAANHGITVGDKATLP